MKDNLRIAGSAAAGVCAVLAITSALVLGEAAYSKRKFLQYAGPDSVMTTQEYEKFALKKNDFYQIARGDSALTLDEFQRMNRKDLFSVEY